MKQQNLCTNTAIIVCETILMIILAKVRSVNSKDTRLSNQKLALNLPPFRMSKYQHSIKYKDAKIWNAIPNHSKSLLYSKLLKKYKEHLISLYQV